MTLQENIKEAAEILKKNYGSELSEPVRIFSIQESIAKSGMSAVYSQYIIIKNRPVRIITSQRIAGYGFDRGYDLAYNIFRIAYGDKYRYQDYMEHNYL